MSGLKSMKLAKGIIASLVVLALLVLAAFVINAVRANRNQRATNSANRTSSQKTEEALARPAQSQSEKASDKPTVEELGGLPSKRGPRYALSFTDEQHGWLADDLSLWSSTDGGRNWKLLLSSDDIVDIFFSTRQIGWLERASGTYRSDDGGTKWTKISTPLRYPKGMIEGMYFLSDGQTGWLAGGRYKPVTLKRLLEEPQPNYLVRSTDDGANAFLNQAILKTSDGGKTWRRQSLPDEVGKIFSLNFADPMRGVALGESDVFFTKDGGKEWRQAVLKQGCVDPAFIKFPDSRPRAVAFAENNLAWLSYDNGRLLKSMDGGESWCDLLRPEEVWHPGEQGAFFRQLHFVNSTKGWGLQDNGKLFRTEDGGRAWFPIPLNGERVWEVKFFKNHALLVTEEKILKITF